MKKITIAIDGHSSCGKSTMAKELARKLGYVPYRHPICDAQQPVRF